MRILSDFGRHGNKRWNILLQNKTDVISDLSGIRRSKCVRYICLNGHQVFCEVDLSFTLCPACLRIVGVVIDPDEIRIRGVVIDPIRGTFDGKMILIDSERRQHGKAAKKTDSVDLSTSELNEPNESSTEPSPLVKVWRLLCRMWTTSGVLPVWKRLHAVKRSRLGLMIPGALTPVLCARNCRSS